MNKFIKQNILAIALLAPALGFSQIPGVDAMKDMKTLMQAGEDAGKIAEAYGGPLLHSLGTGLNASWYNTGAVHKLGRFDVTLSLVPIVFVPETDRSYDPKALDLKAMQVLDKGPLTTPTISGKMDDPRTTYFLTNDSKTDTIFFQSPKGGALSVIPTLPQLTASVGLIKGTEIGFRIIPTISIQNNSFGMYGFSVKHDIKQWIPGISMLPFDWSAQIGYSNLTVSADMDGKQDGAKYSDQQLTLKTNAYTFNTIVSKKIAILTVWASAGYQSSNTDMTATGTFGVEGFNSGGLRQNLDVKDPFSVNVSGKNSPTLGAGFRAKFLVFTVSGGVMLSKYTAVTPGLGVSFDFL